MWCHDKHDAVAHVDDRKDCDSHREGKSDDHASLDMGTEETIRRLGVGTEEWGETHGRK